MRIALVSYLNTTPYLEGLAARFSPEEAVLMPMPPAECARAIREGRADVVLIPVAALPEAGNVLLLEDHCIGANDKVDSVFLFADCPMHEITEVICDPHSRTSNMLTRILLRRKWKQPARILPPVENHFELVRGTTAAVGIGDKAWAVRNRFTHVWDLATEWHDHTGLPMVFAVWAYREGSVSVAEVQKLDEALHLGRTLVQQAAHKYAERFGHTPESALHYLTHSIDFRFNADRHRSLALLLSWLAEEQEA